MDRNLYAVERYGPQRTTAYPEPRLPLTEPARLVGVIRLTDDDVSLALVEGPDPDSVRASMIAAGWRVDRITSATWMAAAPAGGAGGSATARVVTDEGGIR